MVVKRNRKLTEKQIESLKHKIATYKEVAAIVKQFN